MRILARWTALGAAAALFMSLVAVPSRADTTYTAFSVDSTPGDPVGVGASFVMTEPTYTFLASTNYAPGAVQIDTVLTGTNSGGWQAIFVPPSGQQLTQGVTYQGTRAGQANGSATLIVSSESPGCDSSDDGGPFTIDEIQYASDGSLLSFAASFEQSCYGTDPPLYGEVRWHSSIGYQAAGTSPKSLDFGNQSVDSPSSPLSVTVSNLGTEPVTPGALTVSGTDSSQFSASSDSCTVTLQPGDTCTIGVVFAPQGSAGDRSAVLHLADDTRHGSRDVPLTGVAFVPDAVTATVTGPASTLGPVIFTFADAVKNVASNNVQVRPNGSSHALVATLTCKNNGSVVSCLTGPITVVVLQPASWLIPGQEYLGMVNPDGTQGPSPVLDMHDRPAAWTVQDFRGSLYEEENSPAATYSWRTIKTSAAFGGSYVTEHTAGASAAFAFSGTSITWWTKKGPYEGIATISIDGVSKGSYNLYSPAVAWRFGIKFVGLAAHAHVITVNVTGKKGSAYARGTFVAVDAFLVGTTWSTSPSLALRWSRPSSSAASSGRFASTDQVGTSASFHFSGTDIGLFLMCGPAMGSADIYIDGVLVDSLDLYWGVLTDCFTAYSGPAGLHVVKMVVGSSRNAKSKGYGAGIDAWAVG